MECRCLARPSCFGSGNKWHWRKTKGTPRDVVVNRKTGAISLELELARDAASFELVIGGGAKQDRCLICRWELFESEDEHGTGYTNGRDWLCLECHDRFWERTDFISGAFGEST